jgi:predicted phage terminase large subunit-like protein
VDALEACRRGEIRRLIINLPPRSLKSITVSVAFVAWLLGHDPSTQIICASYAQELANKHARDTLLVMKSEWYENLFSTRLSDFKQSAPEFITTRQGCRIATSVGGVLTGRGASFIIIDDPLRPQEAVSDTQRKSCNDWFDNSLISRLNDKQNGCIILVMQRLHEDDLTGHVQALGAWKTISFPAIAEHAERHIVRTPFGIRSFERREGEALHAEREPLEVLADLRKTLGEYNFASQYQQAPAPLGGGMVKSGWFKTYTSAERPAKFELVFQSWDTANKASELSDYSVCTTWGLKDRKFYLLSVLRARLEYPDLKRAVMDEALRYKPDNILIEDKASGTQLIQELTRELVSGVTRFTPAMDKVMRLHSITSTIENGSVYLPEDAPWLSSYLHELITFPNGKYDDQADSTSQALHWAKQDRAEYGLLEWFKRESEKVQGGRASLAWKLPLGWRGRF